MLPIMAHTGRSRPKGFGYSDKWVGISLAEVYEWVEKSVILVGKKAQNGYQMIFMAVKKSRKRSGFVLFSYF